MKTTTEIINGQPREIVDPTEYEIVEIKHRATAWMKDAPQDVRPSEFITYHILDDQGELLLDEKGEFVFLEMMDGPNGQIFVVQDEEEI